MTNKIYSELKNSKTRMKTTKFKKVHSCFYLGYIIKRIYFSCFDHFYKYFFRSLIKQITNSGKCNFLFIMVNNIYPNIGILKHFIGTTWIHIIF